MKSVCALPVQDDCSQTDTASWHPDFLTVFWDQTCHPCQQSPGDLLANGATVSHGPLGATGQSPLLFMSLSYPFLSCCNTVTIVFLLSYFYLSNVPPTFSHIVWFCQSVRGLNPGVAQFHLFRPLFLPSQLIYGGWRVALVLSYDVWPQRLFLSALIWQCYCCHNQAVTPFSYFFFTSPHLKAQEYLAQSEIFKLLSDICKSWL